MVRLITPKTKEYLLGIFNKLKQLRKPTMENQIKEKRVLIDALIITIGNRFGSRECALAKTELQKATMFFGKVLGDLSVANPYPESKDPKSSKIEVRADQATGGLVIDEEITSDQTALVKYLRGYIGDNIVAFTKTLAAGKEDKADDLNRHIDQVLSHLEEAIMWLGQELNNIRLQQERMDTLVAKFESRVINTAKESYDEYGKEVDYKNFQGNAMPTWDELPPNIQKAWGASVKRFISDPRENGSLICSAGASY